MNPTRTDFLQGIAVSLCSVAFVPLEIVIRVMSGKNGHHTISDHFCDNTCRSYRLRLFITSDDGLKRDSGFTKPDGVDQKKLWSDREAFDGSEHGEACGVENVDRVDFLG